MTKLCKKCGTTKGTRQFYTGNNICVTCSRESQNRRSAAERLRIRCDKRSKGDFFEISKAYNIKSPLIKPLETEAGVNYSMAMGRG